MASRSACSLFALLACCAPRSAAPQSPVLALEPTSVTPDRPPPAGSATHYAELVQAASARGEDTSTPTCLLEQDAVGLRVVGAATPALRPLPPAVSDLDPALARSITINVLTPFGRYGAVHGALTLASFSYAPPTRKALALIITDLGIALRGTSANTPLRDKLSAIEAVQSAAALQPATVFVSAEGPIEVSVLADLLRMLESAQIPVALAVPLSADTRLPESARGPVAETCPEGLPDTAAPEGSLEPTALAPALTQLRARAADCLANADPRGAAGGKLNLLLRVAETGMLAHACIDHDEIGDARLRACILTEASKLRFPAPSPRGSVDFALPLVLAPSFAPAVPVLCALPLAR